MIVEKRSYSINFKGGFILYEPPNENGKKPYILITIRTSFDNWDDLKEVQKAIEEMLLYKGV